MSMVLSSRGQKLLLMDFSQESENFFPPVHWWGKHSLGGGGQGVYYPPTHSWAKNVHQITVHYYRKTKKRKNTIS